MQVGTGSRLAKGVAAAILAGGLGWSGMAQAQTISDAQVEASALKALAAAPDLTNQAITTTTVYGVVTLTGSVATETLRTEAETIVSRTMGVKKVVDELTLGPQTANAETGQDSGGAAPADGQGTNPDLQSDGTMAPPQGDQPQTADQQGQAPVAQGAPDANGAPTQPNMANGPNYSPGAPESSQQQYPGGYGPPQDGQQGYSQQGPPPGYAPQGPYNGQQQGYGGPPQGYAPPPGYAGGPQQNYGGQQAGEVVTVPSGAMVRVRINQTLDSARTKPGDHFDGIVVNDVVASGAVAIPRGAAVQGTVIDAKKSGVLAGRGELSLQLNSITLGGKSYPIVSDVWAHHGTDKAVQSVNSTAVGGGVGALIGAAAGGGEGAAIGAGVGGLLGLGSSAASHSGQVFIPSEGLLTFHLAQPASLATVSQAEMDRLAQGAGPAAGPQQLRRRYPYPYPYYGPGYYRPYPYPYYPY